MKKSVADTVSITVMILIIITGAVAFGQILAASGATRGLIGLVSGLTVAPLLIMGMMQLSILLLGTFLNILTIMMVTLPVYMPIVSALGFDPIWFGLLMLINLEMAQTTPPYGQILFVMKGVAPPDTTMGDVILAGFPFLLCDLIAMILCLFFPILPLWLPSLMK